MKNLSVIESILYIVLGSALLYVVYQRYIKKKEDKYQPIRPLTPTNPNPQIPKFKELSLQFWRWIFNKK